MSFIPKLALHLSSGLMELSIPGISFEDRKKIKFKWTQKSTQFSMRVALLQVSSYQTIEKVASMDAAISSFELH
jgi:hypothetical protein